MDKTADLVNADVLLLGLHHPHPLLPHLVHDPEDVDHVVLPDALQDPVDGDHGAAAAHARAAVRHDRPLLRADALAERADEPEQEVLLIATSDCGIGALEQQPRTKHWERLQGVNEWLVS